MQWDLGIAGLGLLAGLSVGYGLVAQLIMGRYVPRWLWLVSSGAYFVAGLLVSEWWFGWATEEELQPNIDGLSLDEVQLVSLLGLVAAVVARIVLARRARRPVQPGEGQGHAQPSA